MTPAELDDALDAMQTAVGDADRLPGLITVQTNDWINSLSAVGAKCARLDDGLRYRDVVVHIGAQKVTRVLTRAEASDRGGPYRDLTPKS
ncbi:hypothetical protein [Brevundimonas sp.]|uniref:hypothetical protein n=1 Tax=Brevundimonas sp. TaxID=1871086 RepID=UPI0019BFAD83|nr:hypothetical protein [Brevundimonas sp.]MBD3836782.1 hypothetical protein [Brevundimonas sp.]